MKQTYKATQWLPYPVEEVFAFFANPANLPPLMPSWQQARIDHESHVDPSTPAPEGARIGVETASGSGTQLTLSFRPVPFSPVRLRWDALIEDFRWNGGFCDVQVRGPFRYWRHYHSVRTARSPQDGSPGTELQDEVHFEAPLGTSDLLLSRAVIHWQFRAIFRFRHQQTAKLLTEKLGAKRHQIVSRMS